jgi:very-short-patch-repair endonuclease
VIHDAGLPMPLVGATIAGHRADFASPEQRLIVETDGWAAHGNRAAFERDRARDVAHALAGRRVVRFTGRRIDGRPLQVAAELGGLLRGCPPGRRSAA